MTTFSASFLVMLAGATILRGLGAGIIVGVGLITMPTRRRLGTISYAQFVRAHYKGAGVRAYAGITILGALLTLALSILAFQPGIPQAVTLWIIVSLLTTILGFVGTGGAFPAMRQLWQTSDDDEALLTQLLNCFARWHVFSAVWRVIAFIAILCALTLSGSQ